MSNTTPHACPDCRPDTELAQPHPGIYVLTVLHDETCPWFAARRREREQ